jgi:uncharacterized protein YcsI (UPF0317 family)
LKNFKFKKLFIFIIIAFAATIMALTFFKYSDNNPIKNNTDSSTNDNSDLPYYKSLYGTWSIESHIPSNIKTTLSDSIISFCIGQKFTIEKDKITSIYASISNPTINEGIMTASEFYNTYNDTFKNIGIHGDKIKSIRITQSEKTNHSVTLFISDDGKVYAMLNGALFELKKQ